MANEKMCHGNGTESDPSALPLPLRVSARKCPEQVSMKETSKDTLKCTLPYVLEWKGLWADIALILFGRC